jgi:RNA polymerase sigma-70 factor (ECF subfamily)
MASTSATLPYCRPGGCALLCTETGLAAAYAQHHTRLLRRARRVVVDPHLAEEAVQEAFTRAWRACSSFDPAAGPLVHWLLAITGNVAIDLVKARRRRPQVAASAADAGTTTAGGIDLVVLRAELRAALAGVSEKHRNAVIETILFDRPHADVAGELGIDPGTLRTRVHYGLRRLRAALSRPDDASTCSA